MSRRERKEKRQAIGYKKEISAITDENVGNGKKLRGLLKKELDIVKSDDTQERVLDAVLYEDHSIIESFASENYILRLLVIVLLFEDNYFQTAIHRLKKSLKRLPQKIAAMNLKEKMRNLFKREGLGNRIEKRETEMKAEHETIIEDEKDVLRELIADYVAAWDSMISREKPTILEKTRVAGHAIKETLKKKGYEEERRTFVLIVRTLALLRTT